MRFRQVLATLCAAALPLSTGWSANPPPADVSAVLAQYQADSALLSGWQTEQLKNAIPFNATAGNVVPKQLSLLGFDIGVEGVVSGTKVDQDGLHHLGTSIVDTTKIDVPNRLPVPSILVHAKIGLPLGLDGGIRFGGIPSTTRDNGTTHSEVKNTIFGLDLRKKIIEEGIGLPGLTVGANFTRANGSSDVTDPLTADGTTVVNGTTYNTQLNATGHNHSDWDVKSYGLQAILNKQILFFNPYIGASVNRNAGSITSSIGTAGSLTLSDNSGNSSTQDLGNIVGTGSDHPNKWDVRALVGFEFSILPFMKLGFQGEFSGDKNEAGALGIKGPVPLNTASFNSDEPPLRIPQRGFSF